MATSTAVSVEEYLRTSYRPDMEYVDGHLVERHVGEYFHSRMQVLIGAALQARSRERRFRGFIAQRVQVSAQPRYRVPDVCVKALPYHVTPILDRPDLVVEILSPDDKPSETFQRIADYRAAGVPHIWIVDPYERTVFEEGPAGLMAAPDLTLHTDLVGEVDFRALFKELYEPAE